MTEELTYTPEESIPSRSLLAVVPKFRTIAAFRLEEDSNVHLENGEIIKGQKGEWVLQVDYFAYVVVSNSAFRALFKSPPVTI